jgi:serpin B
MKHGIFIFTLIFLTSNPLSAQQSDSAGSLNSFSFDLYRQLKSDKENLFFSPLSIDIALIMAKEGARNDTKKAFEKVLHIDSNMVGNDALNFVQNLKSCKDSSNQLNIANAIWIQRDFILNADFLKSVQTNYLADAFPVDFLNKYNSVNQINKWAAQKTNNLIQQVISPDQINDSTRLVITNAIYFMGKWAKKFESNLTRKDDFYGINRDTVKTDFMHETGRMDYFENNDFQMIAKYYKGYDKSFCVILPKKRYGISAIETRMDKSLFDSILNHVVIKEVVLSIPKLRLETGYSLKESLSRLGLEKAFTDKADFTGISAQPLLKISNVSQVAYINVDEVKTEAAAVTKITMSYIGSTIHPKPKPIIYFTADHPFLFLIIDNQTKGIVFMGRYVKKQ